MWNRGELVSKVVRHLGDEAKLCLCATRSEGWKKVVCDSRMLEKEQINERKELASHKEMRG